MMNVYGSTSLWYENIFNTTSANGTQATKKVSGAQELSKLLEAYNGGTDSVSISEEALALSKAPPVPRDMPDVENMSDEELVDFLETMQARTGSIPGVEAGVSAADLTSEQLQSVRGELTAMSSRMTAARGPGGPVGMQGMQGPPPQMLQDVESMSDEELTELLEQIKEDTGSIPGIEDSESTDVSELTDEELQDIRDELAMMREQQAEKMAQNRRMSQAITAYGISYALIA